MLNLCGQFFRKQIDLIIHVVFEIEWMVEIFHRCLLHLDTRYMWFH